MSAIGQFALSVGVLLLASMSLLGWGGVVRRAAGCSGGVWPVTMALGLGAVLAIGGIVNLARIAFAVTLWVIAAAGLLFLAPRLRSWPASVKTAWRAAGTSERIEAAAACALIALVAGLTVATQAAPEVFNVRDDFPKYFAHPARELQTGTLFGSPLSALGSETLGGMAFLHSFVLSIAPIEFINGVDAVLGLTLLLALGAVAGWRRIPPLPGATVALLLIATINPQYANVSSLFLGAALMATAALLAADERERYPPSGFAMGLVYGGLVALKPTFLLFIALHLPMAAGALGVANRSARDGLTWGLRTAAWTGLAVVPWIGLHVPHYLDAWGPQTAAFPVVIDEQPDLSFDPNPLGGTRLTSHIALLGLALLAGLLGLMGAVQAKSGHATRRCINVVAIALALALAWVLLVFVLAPLLAGPGTSVRYAAPFLLGLVPVAVALSLDRSSSWPNWITVGVPIAASLAVALGLLPSSLARYQQAIEFRSILATQAVRSPAYRDYNRRALSTVGRQAARRLQALIPPDVPLIAWISQPYHLDFRRNQVFDVDPAGLATFWAHAPAEVRYVIWEYPGYSQKYGDPAHAHGWHERLIRARALAFAKALDNALKTATIIYRDDRIVVARLPDRGQEGGEQ